MPAAKSRPVPSGNYPAHTMRARARARANYRAGRVCIQIWVEPELRRALEEERDRAGDRSLRATLIRLLRR